MKVIVLASRSVVLLEWRTSHNNLSGWRGSPIHVFLLQSALLYRLLVSYTKPDDMKSPSKPVALHGFQQWLLPTVTFVCACSFGRSHALPSGGHSSSSVFWILALHLHVRVERVDGVGIKSGADDHF